MTFYHILITCFINQSQSKVSDFYTSSEILGIEENRAPYPDIHITALPSRQRSLASKQSLQVSNQIKSDFHRLKLLSHSEEIQRLKLLRRAEKGTIALQNILAKLLQIKDDSYEPISLIQKVGDKSPRPFPVIQIPLSCVPPILSSYTVKLHDKNRIRYLQLFAMSHEHHMSMIKNFEKSQDIIEQAIFVFNQFQLNKSS